MFELTAVLIGLFCVAGAVIAYRRYDDAFHPMVVLAPLMFVGYCLWPLLLNREGDLSRLLGEQDLAHIGQYYLLAIVALVLGLSLPVHKRTWRKRASNPWKVLAGTVRGEQTRKKLQTLSIILAVVANLVYWAGISNVGGLENAYSDYKGGGRLEAGGWVTEMVNLSFPAALLFALSRKGHRVDARLIGALLLILLPSLLQGTLGVRRGPLFLSLCTFYLSVVVARGKPPRIIASSFVLGLIILVVTVVWTQRRQWFEENAVGFDSTAFTTAVLGESENLTTNDYVSGVASAITTDYYDTFFWGRRWLVDIFIRPVPRAIWPTKYEDVGAYWKIEAGTPAGHSELEQLQVVGFALPRGHSIGFLSDLYSEFYWGGAIAVFFFGLLLRYIWIKHRTHGQLWSVYMLVAYALSIYLPTQSFSAWYHRFLLMAVLTLVAWRWAIGPQIRVSQRVVKRGRTDWNDQSRPPFVER